MKEYFSLPKINKSIDSNSEFNKSIKNLLAVKIKRLKISDNINFLKSINKYEAYLPTEFKERLAIYLEDNLDLDSPLGKELKADLKEIIMSKDDKAELADYEVIDNN